ncbi:unnamed protein product [Rotaria sp. Silwood2]|nr:unnamed protein product [Rotaria sp. Silwood2]CAF3362207.1 unnamed protein product [Rotaria sp. Silwood2]CAF4049028.1 unnamed protein product [Rotaria sp. Silwood2]CAF4083878.1 unnamed protein product [Rotaria sp. Silwood2]
MDIPTLKINGKDLQNLISFIYKHEQLLKEFGAVKIQPNIDCQLALKKRRKNIALCPCTETIVRINKNEPVYLAQKFDYIDNHAKQASLVTDECSFWSSLSCSSNEQRLVNTSLVPNKSFFSEKTSRLYFDIHRLPYQSLLKLGGTKVTRQFVPCVKRAFGPGAIFPMTSARQRLFSIDYHHEGGAHHWYIVPTREREILQEIIDHYKPSMCLDHGQLLIDPLILDKNHIRYHRVIQHPGELVVLSAGALAQSFTEDASWSESIAFALPSWIEEGHASVSVPRCQCNISQDFLPEIIDTSIFRPELIQRYITSHLNVTTDDESLTLKGS